MIGMLVWRDPREGSKQKNIRMVERSVLHVRFVCVEVSRGPRSPETVLRRRVAAAGRRMRKQGITRAVLPENFTYGQQLAKYGVAPVSTLILRQTLAADWVRWALEERGLDRSGARVAVAAAQLTGEVVRTVTELTLRYRYVLLDLPRGGEELARQLRREYGVSLLLGPSPEQMEGAEALVAFVPRPDAGNPAVIPLYEGAETPLPPLMLPTALEERLPAGADRGQLLAALQEAGALRRGQISMGTGAPRP